MEPQPFRIHVPDATLADLRERLSRVRWPDRPPDSRWQFGTDRDYLQDLAAYWRDHYIQRWTPMSKGGHFAAFEQPAALAKDIRAFFRQFR